jgi:hypothetical protein
MSEKLEKVKELLKESYLLYNQLDEVEKVQLDIYYEKLIEEI